MAALTIQDVSRCSGLSEPTLRYYEGIGLIGPIERDPSSRHRRYGETDLDTLQALACLRAMGVGIEDMRTYQSNRGRGRAAAGEQRDLLLRHAERIEAEIETRRTHLDYLRAKAALWDARDHGDGDAEAAANVAVQAVLPRLEEAVLPRLEEAVLPRREETGRR
jgi:MerR family transcriptional regulator, copper efflux regulator